MSSTTYYNFLGRLAQFRNWSNEPNSWAEHWRKQSVEHILQAYSSGILGEYEIFTRYLPQNALVLEAGCGMGQLVLALQTRGYQVEGVDYDAQTIAAIKEMMPQLNIHFGDVYDLDVPDGTYGAYISMGVVEHDPDGPLEILKEARRVLRSDGVAFITVPYLNKKRTSLVKQVPMTMSADLSKQLRFYQYYFATSDFDALLVEAGFQVVEHWPYGVYAGLTRDFQFGVWLNKHKFFFWPVEKRFTRWCREAPLWARFRWAHMMMYVCRPIK